MFLPRSSCGGSWLCWKGSMWRQRRGCRWDPDGAFSCDSCLQIVFHHASVSLRSSYSVLSVWRLWGSMSGVGSLNRTSWIITAVLRMQLHHVSTLHRWYSAPPMQKIKAQPRLRSMILQVNMSKYNHTAPILGLHQCGVLSYQVSIYNIYKLPVQVYSQFN